MPKESKLGVDIGGNYVLSAVGQADDVALISNDIHKLQHILDLVLNYCEKFNVKLSSSKTKLLMVSYPRQKSFVPFNPIVIDGKEIAFAEQAEHVVVVRSTQVNLPNIFLRIAAFKKALGELVSCGLAKGSRSSPV